MSTLTGTRSPTRDGSEGTPTFMVPSNPEGQAGLGFCAHFHDEKTALEKLGGCSLGGRRGPPAQHPTLVQGAVLTAPGRGVGTGYVTVYHCCVSRFTSL